MTLDVQLFVSSPAMFTTFLWKIPDVPSIVGENIISIFAFLSIVTQIAANGFFSIGFLLYCIFAVILLIGISEVCVMIKLSE